MAKKVLGQKFFERKTETVARELLGKFLVRKFNEQTISFKITEVEVYDGFQDLASHASRKMTERNKIMFGQPGRWYVYFVYGMHYMLNIVTREAGYPAAILIRGVEGVAGPGRVTKRLRINLALNDKRASRKSGLWIEDREVKIPKHKIRRAPRIGVQYAGDIWREKLWRFYLE